MEDSVEVSPLEPSVPVAEPVLIPARNPLSVAFTPSSIPEDAEYGNEAAALFDSLLRSEDDAPTEVVNANIYAELCSSLVRGVVSGETVRDDALQKIKDYLQLYPNLLTFLVDEIQIAEYASEVSSAEGTRRLSDFVAQLVAQNLVPLADARERLEQEVLGKAELSEKGAWDTRLVRVKTKWFFKLSKFNLYREEAEGFTELINVLDQASVVSPAVVTEKILELAGMYDLDVYRIMDTILTASCLQPQAMSHVLLSFREAIEFDIATLISLMGGKLKLYGQKSGKDFFKVRGLCEVACRLVQSGITSWSDIVPHVPLAKEEAEAQWKDMFERATAEDQMLHTNKRSVKEQFNNMDKIGFDGLIDFFEENKNPRIELVTTMCRFGMYHDAMRLISEMPVHYASTFEPLALEMGKVVHYIIDPLYRSIGLDALFIPTERSNFPAVINDQIPGQITSFDGLCGEVDAWLMLLGSNIIYDRTLMTKWLRIAQAFVKDTEGVVGPDMAGMDADREKVYREILHIVEHCILPALTRGVGSSSLSEQVFVLLKAMPYNIRFALYHKTKLDFYPHGHPMGIMAKAISLTNVKWFQRRINKDNLKLCGRLLSKDLYNNALVICTYLSERIGSMDNFGLLVTDAMKSMASAFSADIMLYSMLEYMTMPANNNHKHDAMTIMPWYRYAASFISIFAKKLPVELEAIIEYVVGMLKAGQTVDLLLLKEMVHKLSGIEVSEGVTDEQLEALAGGEVLKAEGAYFSPMRNTKRSSVRLKDALLKSGQALPLCLLISHAEADILYRENQGKNLKLVGLLYDMCHDTLVQYGTFLATNLTKKEYADNFPSLAVLIHTYKMPFECSIFLLRSVYWNEISSKIEEFKVQQNIPAGPLSDEHFKVVQETFSQIFDSVITSVVDLITPVMTQAPMEDISLRFYVLYWFLSLYDLYVPKVVYEQEIEKLQEIVDQPDVHGDDHIQTVYKKKKEKERAQIVIARLREEMSIQQQHVQMLHNHLSDEKDRWFQGSTRPSKNDVVSQFLQMCVLPRCTFSTIDALYSAHFISTLHGLRTLNFSTLLCYDRMLCDITSALTSCSENEASRYGRLLHTILKTIMKWHGSKAVFDAECENHPGFNTKFKTPAVQTPGMDPNHMNYENFRHVCHKWHYKLTKSMCACLESESYVRIRNGLIVLDKVLPYYPVVTNFFRAIEVRVQSLMLSEKEKRPDLYSLAFGYMGRLRAQKSQQIVESVFHSKETKADAKEVGSVNGGDKVDGTVSPSKDPKPDTSSPVKSEVRTEGPVLSATKLVNNQEATENKDQRKRVAATSAENTKKDGNSAKPEKSSPVENGPVRPEVDSEDSAKHKPAKNGPESTSFKLPNGEATSGVSPTKRRERISPPRSAGNEAKAKAKKEENGSVTVKSEFSALDNGKKTTSEAGSNKVEAGRTVNGSHASTEEARDKQPEANASRPKRPRVSSAVSIVSSIPKSNADKSENEEKKSHKTEPRPEDPRRNDVSTLFQPDTPTTKDPVIKKERRGTTRFQDAPSKPPEEERTSSTSVPSSTVLVVGKKHQNAPSGRKVHSDVEANGSPHTKDRDSRRNNVTAKEKTSNKEQNRVASKIVTVEKNSPSVTSSRRSPRSERTKEKDVRESKSERSEKTYDIVEFTSLSSEAEKSTRSSDNDAAKHGRSAERKEWSKSGKTETVSSSSSTSRKANVVVSSTGERDSKKDHHRSRPSSAKNSPSLTRESSREKSDRRSPAVKRRRDEESIERSRQHRKSTAY